MPTDAIAIIIRKFVVKAVIAFAVCDHCTQPMIARGFFAIKFIVADHVRIRVDKECGVHDKKHA